MTPRSFIGVIMLGILAMPGDEWSEENSEGLEGLDRVGPDVGHKAQGIHRLSFTHHRYMMVDSNKPEILTQPCKHYWNVAN